MKDCSETQYIEWFIAALRGVSIKENEQEAISRTLNIVPSCLNCNLEVKKSLESNYKDWNSLYDEFRLNSTIVLLSGCPSVNLNEKISSSKQLQSFIKSVPILTEKEALEAIQALKNYRFLRGILPLLPVESIFKFTNLYIEIVECVTAVSLAISFELLFAIMYASQYESDLVIADFDEAIDKLISVFKAKSHSFNSSQEIKMEAYYFLYLLESIFMVVDFIQKGSIEDSPTAGLGLKFKDLVNIEKQNLSSQSHSSLIKILSQLIKLSSEVLPKISIQVWVEWHNVKVPGLGLPSPLGHIVENERLETSPKSIQTHVSHLAYKLRKVLNLKPALSIVEESSHLKDLEDFLNHTAVNPNHDADSDLSTAEILEVAFSGVENMERELKLMSYLIAKNDIFSSEKCLEYIRNNLKNVNNEQIVPLMKRFLHYLQNENSTDDNWKQVVLALAQRLRSKDLVQFVQEDLQNGTNCFFQTDKFSSDLTHVFNQLAESPSEESSNLYVWLCLQNGTKVVKQSVDLVLNSTGLSSVVAASLKTVFFICKEKLSGDGPSLLISCLKQHMTESMDDKKEKEFHQFISVLGLQPSISELNTIERLPISIPEVIEYLVCPFLNGGNDSLPQCLPLSLSILKNATENYPFIIANCGSRFSSLFVCLVLFYNNLSELSSKNVSTELSVRNSLEEILISLMTFILKDCSKYERDMLLIQQILSKYELTTRCLCLGSPILKVRPIECPIVDQIFYFLFFSANDQHIYDDFRPKEVPHCGAEEFLLSLCLILPHASYEEWTCAMRLIRMHHKFSMHSSTEIIHVLSTMQETLLLLSAMSVDQDNSISIPHCFKAFNFAINVFLTETLSSQPPSKKFNILVDLFVWWCRSLKEFLCDPELPCVIIGSICNLMCDIINSKTLIVRQLSNNQSNECDQTSLDNSKTTDHQLDNQISSEVFKQKLDLMTYALVKNGHAMNNSALTVAGKLKSLLDIVVV